MALRSLETRYKKGNKRVVEAMNRVHGGTPEAHKTEEALAYLLEHHPKLTFLQKVMVPIRKAMRKLFGKRLIDSKVTEPELRQIVIDGLKGKDLLASQEIPDFMDTQIESARAHVFSDAMPGFRGIVAAVTQHEPIIVGHGRQAVQRPDFHWVNTLLDNLKRAISGSYHAFKFRKYAQSHFSEYAYRFNRRFDLASLIPTLVFHAARSTPKPERFFRAAEI